MRSEPGTVVPFVGGEKKKKKEIWGEFRVKKELKKNKQAPSP